MWFLILTYETNNQEAVWLVQLLIIKFIFKSFFFALNKWLHIKSIDFLSTFDICNKNGLPALNP